MKINSLGLTIAGAPVLEVDRHCVSFHHAGIMCEVCKFCKYSLTCCADVSNIHISAAHWVLANKEIYNGNTTHGSNSQDIY